MDPIDQLKTELLEAKKRRDRFQTQLESISFCIEILQKEVAYRTASYT